MNFAACQTDFEASVERSNFADVGSQNGGFRKAGW